MIRSVIAAIKNSYKTLCKQVSDNLWCRGKLLTSIKQSPWPNLPVKVSNRSITGYHLNTFTIRIFRRFSSAREFQIKKWQQTIPVNPPPFRRSLISRMDWFSCAGDINLPHTPFPPARFPLNKKIKYNKILTYILRSIFLEIPHLELPRWWKTPRDTNGKGV
jgi:hypothetical protein